MPSCIVKGCSFSWKKKDPTITIHAFPRSKEMIKAWLMQTGQDFGDIDAFTDKVFEGKKTDAFRICSQHFTPDSYTNEGMRKSLKKDALPTIFNCNVQAATTVKKIQKKKERLPRPKSAKKIRNRMTQRILNITLEIIYLLTGEDYTVVKSRKRAKMRELGELESQAPTTMTPPPPSHSNEENNDRRILELAYKIIQLLNGEEGDYLEGHHDFYADMLDNEQSFRSHELSEHGLVIYTSDSKEESMLYEEGTFMDNSIYTSDGHQPYISAHDQDESISQEEEEEEEEGDVTDADITCTLVKEEPQSCDEENLTDSDGWALADSSSHVKAVKALYHKGNKSGKGASAPSGHKQQDPSTDAEEQPSDQLLEQSADESISCKDRPLNTESSDEHSGKGGMRRKKAHAKEKVHCPEDDIEYTIVHIKDNSSSEEDKTSTEEFLEDSDMQEDNIVSVNLTHQGGTINNQNCSLEDAMKTYQCVGCQKHFTTKADLQTHQTIHKTFQKSICPECGKTFLCTSALITHRQSHTGEKPFSCTVCGKSFGQQSQLKTHERIHTDEKPFSCSVCGKCFRCRSHLISHARIHKEETVSVV